MGATKYNLTDKNINVHFFIELHNTLLEIYQLDSNYFLFNKRETETKKKERKNDLQTLGWVQQKNIF